MDGIVVVEKPSDMTSYDVIRRLKKIFDTKKIGHAGTLDPFASGVLVIAVNRATKIIKYFSDAEKEYVAKLKLGEMTDTYDLTGTVVKTYDKVIKRDDFADVLLSFKGEQMQIPPMFSAKKINGVKLYKMARKGIEVERKAVRINIKDLKLISYYFPFAEVKVTCSKGTYIRSLANDIGKKLGSFAHLTELARTKSEPFDIKRAHTINGLESAKNDGTLEDKVISMNEALSFMPALTVKDKAIQRISNGIYLNNNDIAGDGDESFSPEKYKGAKIRMVSKSGELLAISTYLEEEGRYKYCNVFLN